ncbi:MAG: anthranilate phosphoribosyltransferase [Candidatus Binataceae bacterium]|nr:anthranilate phosphoribosyltransferase [Candidatus Binataceae bacterium]
MARVLVIDNYDSFTYNLVHYISELGAEVTVRRNDEIDLPGVRAMAPDAIVISPGPGGPAQAGISTTLISELGADTPILGVCLGHQCIAAVFGARIVRAPRLMHGKTSPVIHDSKTIFAGVPTPFEAMRYHSLIVDPDSIPETLEVSARTDEGEVMAIRHRRYPIEGVQFHPESILTRQGKTILANFLARSGVVTSLRKAFFTIVEGGQLDAGEAERAIGELLDDQAPESLAAGFIVALKLRGETAAELAGGVRAMRARARKVDLNEVKVLDTAGTGGDNAGTFNISTGAALIAAAAGVPVAKHGNRAFSGRSGAADALERFGVKIDCDPDGLRRCLRAANLCFIFAPAYHPVLARLAGLRRALAIRTLFNLMAPLANPARPAYQLVGVPDRRLIRPVAEALNALEVEHAMVVHGLDGLDELSLCAPTEIAEVRRGGEIREYQIDPASLGLTQVDISALTITDAADAAKKLREALAGGAGPAQDVLALNAGAAIYVGGKAKSLSEGIAIAREVIISGRALETVEKLRRASHGEF